MTDWWWPIDDYCSMLNNLSCSNSNCSNGRIPVGCTPIHSCHHAHAVLQANGMKWDTQHAVLSRKQKAGEKWVQSCVWNALNALIKWLTMKYILSAYHYPTSSNFKCVQQKHGGKGAIQVRFWRPNESKYDTIFTTKTDLKKWVRNRVNNGKHLNQLILSNEKCKHLVFSMRVWRELILPKPKRLSCTMNVPRKVL